MKKIVLIGCGNVGISYISSLINQNIKDLTIAIIDANEIKTKGEIIDFNHCLPFLNSSITIYYGSYKDCYNADLVVICAGARQEKNETRLDLLTKNANLIKDIVIKVVENGFQGIFLNATNPLDVMCYLIFKYSNFPSNKVIGTGTYLDTARLKFNLKEMVNNDYNQIQAYVLGEHGDSSMIPWSNVKIKKTLTLEEKEHIENKVKSAGYELINAKGYSSSAIGVCLASVTQSIINDDQKEICLSNYDECNNVFYGYPAIIGKEGIKKRVKLNLTDQEKEKLEESIKIIKEAIKKISN